MGNKYCTIYHSILPIEYKSIKIVHFIRLIFSSDRERTPSPQQNHSKFIGKMDEMLAEDATNPIEPLDLSMATAACSDPSSSTLAITTNSNTNNNKQSRKRATEKKENEQQHQMQRKRIKSDEVVGSMDYNLHISKFTIFSRRTICPPCIQ